MRLALPWVVPLQLAVVEPASCPLEVAEHFYDLRKAGVLPSPTPLPFYLSTRCWGSVAHQKAPLSIQFL
jgi:hypothetical protein